MTKDSLFKMNSYEHNRMQRQAPQNFKPDRVVHRVVSISGNAMFEYSRPVKAYAWPQPAFAGIGDLVRFLADNVERGARDAVDPRHPLAIPVNGHAYVVIELSDQLPWCFDPDYYGVTLGAMAAGAADKHRDVLHYNPQTKALQEDGCENCRFVVFSTLLPTPDTPQPINFNLVDGNGTKFTIDPDIRYPGTGGEVGGGGS